MRPKSKFTGSPPDRRAFSRVGYQHDITLKDDGGALYHGVFHDISLKGMLFIGDILPPNGAIVSGFLILGEIKLPIKGVVINSQLTRGAAISFQEMDVESFSHLRRLVALNMGDSDAIDEEFFAAL
ncbi:MAG: PilZ domain-containing protein [Magnetococcales bacterium]|nr:PilZ domain-containing protein [Magnetococcales bacterium]MBF0439511.1 PilZ domain-containing protein [Magnetococcales bacterium]